MGYAAVQLVEALRYKAEGCGFDFRSDYVLDIFRWNNPYGRTRALGSTQPLREMRTRNLLWRVNAAGA